jgi:hypothetical protein
MEKIKKKKSEKFFNTCLQLLALQFPDVKIKYGYGGILVNMHIIELIAAGDTESNKILNNACEAIYSAFKARFRYHEEMLFISPDDDTFKVDKLISEWNIEMSEEDRLYKEFHGPYLPADHPVNCKTSTTQAVA